MTKNYVRHALYLRNLTYDYHLWYTCVKWWYPQLFFSFFQNFDFSGCLGGKRAKNGPKWQKILSVTLGISGTIYHMIVIFGTPVWNDNISRQLFFFKILIFWVVRGAKEQKIVQNDKKLCVFYSISKEPYNICLSFMVYICKMRISSVFFSFFQNFDFRNH